MTWERFKKIFYQKYFSVAHRSTKMTEFINHKQKRSIVKDYIRKFEKLFRFAPHMFNTNVLRVDQFLQGLRAKIYQDVKMMMNAPNIPYFLIVEKVLEAKKVEKRIFQVQQMCYSQDMLRKCIIFYNNPL